MRRTGFHRTGCLVSATALILVATLAGANAQDSRERWQIERSVAQDDSLSQQELRQRADDLSVGEDRESVTRKRLARELMSRDQDITGSIQRPRPSPSEAAVRSAIASPSPARIVVE